MGAKGSSLIGKAIVHDAVLPLTAWEKDDVLAAYERFQGGGGNFALNHEQFAAVLGMEQADCETLFNEVFDTDSNGLVDAYEVVAGLAFASQMSNGDRVDFVHSLYDFNGSGDLTKDEMTILFRTVITGCAKMDRVVDELSIEELEAMSEFAFGRADKDSSGEITKEEFDTYCYSAPKVVQFLAYWDGCLAQAKIPEGESWEDPDFGATGSSLYKDEYRPPPGAMPAAKVGWLRPADFMDDPQLWKGGISAGDVVQGALGDCWFLSALAVMAAKPQLLKQLFVKTGQEEQGRYCVRLFKDGEWINVYVDDRIPCNLADEPMYCKSADPDEFWPCLVEKAYAKAHGSYEALIGGYADYALADMTGGVPMTVRLDDRGAKANAASGKLWEDMQQYTKHGLMGAAHSLRPGSKHGTEQEFSGNVLAGHAYSVLELVEAGGEKLLHIRNPWGMREWTGDWRDGDELWDENPEVAEACKYTGPVDDGCFWMCFDDFMKTFNTLYVVRILEADNGWKVQRREGEWTEDNSGGPPNKPTWVKNSQYAIDLPEDAEVVLSVMQPDARFHVHRGPHWNKYDNAIGLVLMKHDWGSTDLVVPKTRIAGRSDIVAFTAPFKPYRNMTITLDLKAGKYVLLPTTFKAGDVGKYWISVYAKVSKLTLVGGKEVKFDEVMDEEAAALEDFTIKEGKEKPPGQEPHDPEDRAISMLQETVYNMLDAIKELQKRKDTLLKKVAALESAA